MLCKESIWRWIALRNGGETAKENIFQRKKLEADRTKNEVKMSKLKLSRREPHGRFSSRAACRRCLRATNVSMLYQQRFKTIRALARWLEPQDAGDGHNRTLVCSDGLTLQSRTPAATCSCNESVGSEHQHPNGNLRNKSRLRLPDRLNRSISINIIKGHLKLTAAQGHRQCSHFHRVHLQLQTIILSRTGAYVIKKQEGP